MSDIIEIDKRVSVLEVEVENMEISLKKLDRNIENNGQITLQIKERLDKQNGAIPHLSEMVKNMAAQQEKMMSSLTSEKVRHAGMDAKVTALWVLSAGIVTGVMGYAIKSIIG
jgi:chromosome segregation ATPase